MDKEQKKKKIREIRAFYRSNGRFRIEFLAELSKLFRTYDLEIDDDFLSSLHLAIPDEFDDIAMPNKDPIIDP